jgi:TolB-like protein/DNA-binding winged helix-turn-helix (wHTH) protein/Tfp pilus assembly protein PilF
MNKALKQVYEFGPFVLDPSERLVRHGAARMELPPRAFDTLLTLVENNGRLLEKDALMQTVWGDTVVEENNLSQVIYLLRKALRDGEEGVRYIETVPKRGYRFVAEVREFGPGEGNGGGRSGLYSIQPTASSSESVETGLQVERLRPDTPGPLDSRGGRPHIGRSSARQRGWMQGVLGGLAMVAVVVTLLGAGWKQRWFGEVGSSPIRSIAVLPLQNLSNDANQEYFVDGMTDELITELAQIRELKVVSKTSIMQYKGTRIPLPQIGRALGVDAVVEGSVLRSGDRVRITAQLIRTATDRHIWAEAYDGDLKDVLSLQARVAESITNQVKLNLSAEESGRLRTVRAVDPEAFDLYLRGRYAWNQRNVEGFKKAVEYFNQAIEKDPNFALAYSGLADCYTLLTLFGEGSTIAEAKAAAEKALQLDSTLAEAHTSLAAVKILHDWDWQGAEQEFHRAIELNPNFAQAHHWYGNLLLDPQGRHDEAIAELQRAQELDPLSLIIQADTGFAYFLAGRYDVALQAYQKVVAANPNFLPVHYYLTQYYLQTGEYDLWLKESVANARLAGYPGRAEFLQQLYSRGGFHSVMLEMAKPVGSDKLAIGSDSRRGYCASTQANALLGRKAEALSGLEDCYQWNGTGLIYLKVDPLWAKLRGEPRFQDLLWRMHLQ